MTRRAWEKIPGTRPRVTPRLEVEHLPVAIYRRPRWWERTLAALGGGLISIVVGTMLAFALGAGAIWAVSVLTSRLK